MNDDTFFPKKYTDAIKGIAILLMFTLHLLQEGWMANPQNIWDVRINGSALSSIIAYACDICIGIFAFITGYGWSGSFKAKTKRKRIWDIYSKYWFILVLFDVPIRLIASVINEGNLPHFNILEIVLSLFAIQSYSALFQWYVFFFAIAVLTYPYVWKRLRKTKNPIMLCFVLGLLSIAPRIVLNMIPGYEAVPSVIRDSISHYINWMPVILMGSVCRHFGLLERIDKAIGSIIGNTFKTTIAYLFVLFVILGKGFFQFLSGRYVNLDPIYIVPFIYSLILIINSINNNACFNALKRSGGVSLYLWLSHRVLLYEPIRGVILHLRFPVLIIAVSLVIMFPIGTIMVRIERFLTDNLLKHKNLVV